MSKQRFEQIAERIKVISQLISALNAERQALHDEDWGLWTKEYHDHPDVLGKRIRRDTGLAWDDTEPEELIAIAEYDPRTEKWTAAVDTALGGRFGATDPEFYQRGFDTAEAALAVANAEVARLEVQLANR